MAVEAAVGFALGKLANIMMKEREFLGEVGKKVKRVQIELIRNQYSLTDAADSKHNGDARVHNWLNELCEVAYRIEDAIDTFFLEQDYHKKPSFLQKVKKMWNKPSKMHILNELGTELDEIQDKLLGISKSRVDFGFIELQNIVGEDYRFIEWQSILGDDTEVVEDVLASYNDMPYYLKACFQYLACFPNRFFDKISAKRLIRMWIAEGFIPHDKTKTLEETAENCLEELVRRSMVQVSSRSPSGSIKYCKVRDPPHDLAMQTAGQENFVKVFSTETEVNQPNRGIRRFSLQGSRESNHMSELYMKYVGPNTHSILMFQFEYMLLPNFSNFRLLKVLVLENWGRGSDDLQVMGLDELVYLKYLALINCEINLRVKCSFHRMKALETLEIRGYTIELLDHDALWTIGTLRHVLGNRIPYRPPSTIDLRNLQTMKTVCLPRTWDGKFPVLNNLLKLGLYNEFGEWVMVTNLLEVLPSLVSLAIRISWENILPMEIVYPKAIPNYQNLQSLSLEGKWPEAVNLEASSLPLHLVKLKLVDPKFNQNPMPELGKLESLKKLSLSGYCFSYDSPTMCPAGFPVLQNLIMGQLLSQNDFMVAEGVMPNLIYVTVPRNIKLHMPPELHYVTTNYWD